MDRLNIVLQGSQSHNISLVAPNAGTSDYERLKNKPSINSVVLSGDKTSVDLKIVSENTTEGWNENPLYVPKRGEICLFTDTHMIKIGDGSVPIVDLAFIGKGEIEEVRDELQRHVNDTTIHTSTEEKDIWNAKLSCDLYGEELVFFGGSRTASSIITNPDIDNITGV